MFHRPPQFGIFLPDDLVQFRATHPGLYQLLEGLSGFDALMLAGIADEQHAIFGTDLLQEVAHLLGAGKARLIEHIEVMFRRRPLCACEEALQSVGTNAGVAELVRGARGRGEALNNIAALLRTFADTAEDAG